MLDAPPLTPLNFSAHGFQPRCFALVPCAGIGARAGVGGPKQYHPVAGKAVVAHTLASLASVSRLAATLVVLSPDDAVFERHVPAFTGDSAWVARVGGASRAESVAHGLDELLARGADPHDWVLVHDAARCLIQPGWIDRLIDECQDDEVGGLLALPVADTLKAAVPGSAGEARVQSTVDRAAKWSAQTPQMFRLGLLRPALIAALSDPARAAAITDEASAVEAFGHSPRLVLGDFENFKLTWPGDFALAERLLSTRPAG
ncbi:2-C-methyl-D-erythritol 4-phosphate cytidylyltransferase [Aquabacterium sp.]|uniref:2-C-methyl-D-erythritol 4-phosphate cytidylyltransferase n=1 Tax=Aquabacterium sp. TaxID=1872578 RepID=UPI003D6C769C